jgi:hypothetical protein
MIELWRKKKKRKKTKTKKRGRLMFVTYSRVTYHLDKGDDANVTFAIN